MPDEFDDFGISPFVLQRRLLGLCIALAVVVIAPVCLILLPVVVELYLLQQGAIWVKGEIGLLEYLAVLTLIIWMLAILAWAYAIWSIRQAEVFVGPQSILLIFGIHRWLGLYGLLVVLIGVSPLARMFGAIPILGVTLNFLADVHKVVDQPVFFLWFISTGGIFLMLNAYFRRLADLHESEYPRLIPFMLGCFAFFGIYMGITTTTNENLLPENRSLTQQATLFMGAVSAAISLTLGISGWKVWVELLKAWLYFDQYVNVYLNAVKIAQRMKASRWSI